MSKHRIIVDMDGIMADFMEGLWDAVEADLGVRGDTSKVTGWDRLQDGLPDEARATWDMRAMDGSEAPKRIEDYFFTPAFFTKLRPMGGAVDALKHLQEDGHEIVICTANCTAHSAAEKVHWLKEHFPFLDQKNLFIGHRKHMMVGDVLIDDGLHNAVAFRQSHPGALVVTLAYPYNDESFRPAGSEAAYHLRAQGWHKPEFGWGQIVQKILHHPFRGSELKVRR